MTRGGYTARAAQAGAYRMPPLRSPPPGSCNTLCTGRQQPRRNTPAIRLRSCEESGNEQCEPSPGRRCRWRERVDGAMWPIARPSEKCASADPRPAARPAGREESGQCHHQTRSQRTARPSQQTGNIDVRVGTSRLTPPARRERVATTITSLAPPGAFRCPSVLRHSPGGRIGSQGADPRWATPPACGSVRCNKPCRQQPHRCMPDGHSADGSWCSSGYLDGVPAAGDVHESARRGKRG